MVLYQHALRIMALESEEDFEFGWAGIESWLQAVYDPAEWRPCEKGKSQVQFRQQIKRTEIAGRYELHTARSVMSYNSVSIHSNRINKS